MTNESTPTEPLCDVVIVGAGFAGLYALQRLRRLGLTARVFEAGGDVGGTWYWNRYPGCRCDVESMEYSYSFDDGLQQAWNWTERYASQPEILAYARHVAERHDLRRDIEFNTRVTAARWDEASQVWTVRTDTGRAVRARWCLMATGVLSAGRIPEFEGLDQLRCPAYHTSTWPAEGVDFSGQRVAVMGTGSSGVQAIPLIAQQASRLHVLLRTPNYVVPARNGPLPETEIQRVKSDYPALREQARNSKGGVLLRLRHESASAVSAQERERAFEERWQLGGAFNFQTSFSDIQTDLQANTFASDFLRSKIARIVQDPVKARWLQPRHLLGTRRLCVGTDFYETFNRANVDLVNLREEPISGFTPKGVRVGSREIELDAIVFATGFDAMTGALSAIDIVGRGGLALREHWAQGPRAYLGLMAAGFPNLFLITGPGSPSVLSNVIVSIEQHVEWITDCLAAMKAGGQTTIEPTAQAESEWTEHVATLGANSLFAGGESWYLGSNVPGKPRVFLPYAGGVPAYRERCAQVAAQGYTGFTLSNT